MLSLGFGGDENRVRNFPEHKERRALGVSQPTKRSANKQTLIGGRGESPRKGRREEIDGGG